MVSRIVARRPRALSRQRGYLGVGNRRVLGGSGAQTFAQFWSSPSFWAQLTTSIVPDHAAPGTAATFTRATTKTFTDWEGMVRTAVAGEACFTGARRVQNLLNATEAMSGANWATSNGGTGAVATCTSGFTAPDGTATAFRVQANRGASATSSDISTLVNLGANALGLTANSVWIKSNTGVNQNVLLSLSGALVSDVVVATPTWQRLANIPKTYASLSANAFAIGTRGTVGSDQVIDVLVWHPQMEAITGQSNNAPGEYVSVGVLAAPYQGAGVDGVQYFATQNGNTVAANVVTAGTGAAIASSVLLGYSAWQAATNLALQSEDIATTWVAEQATIGAATVAPDGATTAKKIQETAVAGTHDVAQSFVKAASSLTYTASAYFKQAERTWAFIACDDTTNGIRAWFNLGSGTLGSTATAGAGFTVTGSTITPAANGFFRCTVTFTTTASTSLRMLLLATTGDTVLTYTGVLNSGVYAWGAQLEQNAFATPYIQTTTAAVTRNADVLTYPKAGNIDVTVGSSYAEVTLSTILGTKVVVQGLAAEGAPMAISAGGGLIMFDGTNTDTFGLALTPGTTSKCATAWSGVVGRGTRGGVTGTPGTFDGDLSIAGASLAIGTNATPSNAINGNIRNVKLWKTAAPDAYLTQGTT